MKYVQKLKQTRILIFGGSSDLGYAVSEAAIEAGATVIMTSSRRSKVESALARLKASYPSAQSDLTGHVCDLTGSNMERNISALFEQTGKIDHVVFSAGDPLILDDIHNISYDRVVEAGQVRFFAPFFVAKMASKYLRPAPQSSLVFTAGTLIQKPRPGWTVPAAYAAGMIGMVRSLAVDLAPIRINLVSPGPADTEMWKRMPEEQVEATRKAIGAELLTSQPGKPDDVAEAYMACLRDNNMSGAHLYSDGGWPLVPAGGVFKGQHLAL